MELFHTHCPDIDTGIIRLFNDSYSQHHYIKEEPMCASCEFNKEVSSVTRFLEMARTWMKDTLSICALSVRTGRLVGVAVMRINALSEKAEIYNRIQVLKGEVLPKIMHLKNTLVKQVEIYKTLNIEEYLMIYILSIHPSFERKGVVAALMQATISVGRSLKSPIIFGIFTSKVDQDIAETLNFETFSIVQYSRWIVDDEVVFDDPGIGNYSAALMGFVVPKEQPEETSIKWKDSSKKEKI
ncbi:uncharacterized protein LOC124302273 isoform X1 [Neodiprion virginianus]|uniref:uncharacterized protein LOC124302273 isoform X1 n=2 Tax=Neodiprion virginianus TaxID=2961670 RepID=UPI001EE6EC64|nr:uncharacterized protein LOC124302273 isoform X1 [Neodiprion virginianus]